MAQEWKKKTCIKQFPVSEVMNHVSLWNTATALILVSAKFPHWIQIFLSAFEGGSQNSHAGLLRKYNCNLKKTGDIFTKSNVNITHYHCFKVHIFLEVSSANKSFSREKDGAYLAENF